jgi:hypothetical protein
MDNVQCSTIAGVVAVIDSASPEAADEPPRQFSIILDHPRQHLGRRLWRRLSTVAGGILVVVGLTASIAAVPATLAVISFVAGWATTEPSDTDRWPNEDVPVRQVFLAWVVATPLAVGGLRMGLALVRRNRTRILFLRRFGYDEAQNAVTFAVLRTIGSSWRVVTLDDAEMAPIGVAAAPRVLFRAGQVAAKHVLAIAQFLGLRTFPFLVTAMWGVLVLGLMDPALDFARTGTTTPDPWIAAVDPYLAILASVFERRLPLDDVAPTLPGVFALLATAAALSFVTLLVTIAALLVAFPLSTVLIFLSSAASSVQEAEQSKTMAVGSVMEIQRAARAIANRSRKVFGPRLVVLRVTSSVWQYAVSELASLSSLPLIDISEPTEHVLWEIEELTKRFGDKCVLIGQYDQVAALAAFPEGDTPSVHRRLVTLLEGREVLAYTMERQGLGRFARSLRGLLLSRSL